MKRFSLRGQNVKKKVGGMLSFLTLLLLPSLALADCADLSYFTGKLVKPVWSFMPPMVYDTLKFGCSALQKMKIIRLS